jgi:UDP-galactose transporter B1
MATAARHLQLLSCVAGIYVCYLLYGLAQETLYRTQADGTTFAATAFVLAAQCLVNGIIAVAGDVLVRLVGGGKIDEAAAKKEADKGRDKHARASFWSALFTTDVIGTGAVYVFAMYTSNEALQYVSYPTQALAKSCKMIPVMLGRVLYLRHSYGFMKYLCVLLMTVGITVFQMAGSAKKHSASEGFGGEGWGLLLLAASLCLDGVTGPMQEKLKSVHKLSNMEQMLVNNIWATAIMATIAAVQGQVGPAVRMPCILSVSL